MRTTSPPWHVEIMCSGDLKIKNRWGENVATVKRDNKGSSPTMENGNAWIIAESPAMWEIIKLVKRIRCMNENSAERVESERDLDDALDGLFDRMRVFEEEVGDDVP